MVEFRGTPDEKIYIRALRLHGGGLRAAAIIFIIAGIVGIPAFGAAAIIIALCGVILLLLPWFVARRLFRTSALLRLPISGHLDEQGFAAESAHGRSNVAWNLFHRAAVAKDLIVLYISAQQFYTLPREFFSSDTAFAEAQELVRRNANMKPAQSWIKVTVLLLIIIVLLWALLQVLST